MAAGSECIMSPNVYKITVGLARIVISDVEELVV